MASNKNNRRDVPQPAPARAESGMTNRLDSSRRFLVIMFVMIAIGGGMLALALRPGGDVPEYTYEILRRFPHDRQAFTQGLWIDPKDGMVYESTGVYGQSTMRKCKLETGEVLQSVKLGPKEFGEGIAFAHGQLVQLTWQEEKAIVWSMDLERTGELPFQGDGWGLTFDGTHLVMSNGTSRLSFRDPKTFEEVRRIEVTRNGRLVGQLNELEYFGGKIYANRLYTDMIYEIDPRTGKVQADINLKGLWPVADRPRDGLLNGIAVSQAGELVVTGKYCPEMFEVKLKLSESR